MLNRVSLNTIGLNRIGLNRIGKPSRGSSDRPYIDPEVLASLKAVCICYGKSNDDPDRAVVKNLVDPDNPFVISNAAFKLNSGFGKYSADFESFDWAVNISQKQHNKATISLNGRLCNHTAIEVDEMKVNIIGNVTELIYWYIANPDDTTRSEIRLTSGINTLPKSYAKDDGQTYNIGFAYISGDSEITIEQIPSFEGAFVTDGIDDLITSSKTVQEMEITEACTVISMIHHIDVPSDASFNNIRNSTAVSGRNGVYASGTTGIYGWSKDKVSGASTTLINNILGDKNNYTNGGGGSAQVGNMKFSVQGFISDSGVISEISSVAWYWTIIANKVLTTDQINQVIAYYNLDRTLKSDIYCNIAKQGITNENHADFNDKLIDYSGNRRDIQMYNLAWNGNSGIGDYEVDFTTWNAGDYLTVSKNSFSIKSELPSDIIIQSNKKYKAPSFKIKIKGLPKGGVIKYRRSDKSGSGYYQNFDSDGDYECMAGYDGGYSSFMVSGDKSLYVGVTVEQISSKIGALCLDGITDYGQYVGDLGLKDYTLIADRSYQKKDYNAVSIISTTIKQNGDTPFIFEYHNLNNNYSYSFNTQTQVNDFNIDRAVNYQSTYFYNKHSIARGNSSNIGDGLTIGGSGGNIQFASICLYSLMLFPYSMSEFLIERQLKKHKLGTLYPNMVEFRPVITANANYKITYYLIDSDNVWKSIKTGDYITVGTKLAFQITFDNDVSELKEVVSSQLSDIIVEKRPSNPGYNVYSYISSKSPQKINITIDEYIRYEDIVQPYPSLFTLIDYDTEEVYSWGSKLKLGTKFKGEVVNLLPNMYEWQGNVLYNGEPIYWNTTPGVVAKEMTFSWSKPFKYLIDNNEPKVILSPRLLRIPNSSYKILGHIPDISGHGNHGKINNSAYSEMSGANGYNINYTTWLHPNGVELTDSTVHISNSFNPSQLWICYVSAGTVIPRHIINITGIPEGGGVRLEGLGVGNGIDLHTGENIIDSFTAVNAAGYQIRGSNLDWSNLVIEQIGEYEGAYCLDGVDDFITIPTVTGGKQVLMKVNWNTSNAAILYDQRGYNNEFAIYNGTADSDGNPIPAYQGRNNGQTYIDGILNSNIKASELKAITHNITITNELSLGTNNTYPVIGSSKSNAYFTNMSLYDFMLFDKISTDDKIKELNEYVGIEAKVELPPYYWDAYGKTNFDEDKSTIQQRGIAEGDYDLTNYNHAYDKMSGYGGYEFGKFTSSEWTNPQRENGIEVIEKNAYSFTAKRVGTGETFWDFKNNYIKTLNKELTIKAVSNKNTYIRWEFKYRTAEKPDLDSTIILLRQAMTPDVPITVTLPYKTEEEQIELGVTQGSAYYLFYFDPSGIPVGEEYTVEMLPLYPNGLVYDGVTDYSINNNIPAFTDFTAIAKRVWMNKDQPANECFIHKGVINTPISESAFMLEYEITNDAYYRSSSFGGYVNVDRANRPEIITYQTTESYNGISIIKGSSIDTQGLVVGAVTNNYWKGVLYKLILYPKTIPLLQINFLKNLMERDEIIDLNNPIFIQE